MHVPVGDVATLIEASETLVEKAEAALDGSMGSLKALHKAEQVRLLMRLAADSGARRGELVVLRFGDLDGRVLTIERGASGEQVGPTKTRQVRRLTLGLTTVQLWGASEATWRERVDRDAAFGEWVFTRDIDHQRRLTTSGMGHWFAELCAEAGLPGVSLHRLRHTVAHYQLNRQG
jgi:integrase